MLAAAAAGRVAAPRMQAFYVSLFVGLAALAALLESLQVSWLARPAPAAEPRKCCADVGNPEYRRFRNNYVLVYGLMMGARGRGPPALDACHRWPAGVRDWRRRGTSMGARASTSRAAPPTLPPSDSRAATDARAALPPLLPQRATGCRAPTYTRCTSSTGGRHCAPAPWG